MSLLQVILLGLVQGITEFLPVSSTAHLTLVENMLLGHAMPLAFDVMLHVGTLLALVVYFRSEIARVLWGLLGRDADGRKLALWLFVAMIPTGVLGLAIKPLKEAAKAHLWIYGLCLLLTAVLLYVANEISTKRQGRELRELNAMDALAVGAIQGIGGGFGLSRSGSTIAMGAFRGLQLPAAARFSFLLGIPTIAAAALVESKSMLVALVKGHPLPVEDLLPVGGGVHPALLCAVGVGVAALSGYGAIGLLDRFTRKPKLKGFAWYCLAAGILMIIWGVVKP